MSLSSKELEIFQQLNDEDFIFLKSLPFFIKRDNLTLLHAGITNKIDLNNATKKDLTKVLWIRKLDENKNIVSLHDYNKNYKWWSEYYDGNQGIIAYGHQPFDKVKIDRFSIGIDSGCVYGGKLTALIVHDTQNPIHHYEIVDIQSKAYADKEY